MGRVGQDPEIRNLPSGIAVVQLIVATTRKWNDKQTGEKKEETEWHRVNGFGKRAEVIGDYVKKGDQILIEGFLRTRKWEREGQDHYSTEIMMDSFEFVGSNRSGQPPDSQAPQSRGAAKPQTQPSYDDFEDDIPFN